VTPVIDKRYELSEIADALRYMGEGHAQGKIVIAVWCVLLCDRCRIAVRAAEGGRSSTFLSRAGSPAHRRRSRTRRRRARRGPASHGQWTRPRSDCTEHAALHARIIRGPFQPYDVRRILRSMPRLSTSDYRGALEVEIA